MVLLHLYGIIKVEDGLRNKASLVFVAGNIVDITFKILMGKGKNSNTCCQCVGGSSGAVDSTIVSLDLDCLFLCVEAPCEYKSEDEVPERELEWWLEGYSTGPLNSTSNQKPKPWRGALEKRRKEGRSKLSISSEFDLFHQNKGHRKQALDHKILPQAWLRISL